MISWSTLRVTSKYDFIEIYVRLCLRLPTDLSIIQIGIAFDKTPRAEIEILISVVLKAEPLKTFEDIIGRETTFRWVVKEDKIVIWLEIYFLVEDIEPINNVLKIQRKV